MLSGLREGGRSGRSAATICVIWGTGVVAAVVGVESGEESFFGSLARHPEIATHYSRNTKQSATLIRLLAGSGAVSPAVEFSILYSGVISFVLENRYSLSTKIFIFAFPQFILTFQNNNFLFL